MSEVIHITDHADAAKNRLTSQFKGKVKLAGFSDAFVAQYQALEDMFYDMLTERYLYTATGAQLDIIGDIVGATRDGRDDSSYLNRIIAKIGQNTSRGLPENLIAVFNLLTQSTRSQFIPYPPAECDIYANVDISGLDVDDIYNFCQLVLSAGVKLGHIGWFDDTEAFGFYDAADALGFGDALDASVGGKFASIVV